MVTILLVEDSLDTQTLVRHALGQAEHSLVTVATARDALQVIRDRQIDLMILDLSLPDEGGLQLFAQIQSEKTPVPIPVIVLTGTTDVYTKVAAFSMGIEDYIVKPFNGLEFKARVEAKIRKIQRAREQDEILTRRDLQLNLSRQKAYLAHDGKPADLGLTPLEFKLLYQLARHDEHVLSRDQLLTLVWGETSDVLDRTVDSHISVLRRKLGEYGRCIEAIAGTGYRFSAEKLAAQGEKRKSG